MSMCEHPISVSEVRHEFGTFFEKVKDLYNLTFWKKVKCCRAVDVKKYANELFEANRISDYIHSLVGEAIQNFTLLSPVNLKEMNPDRLDKLNRWIHLSINDINLEISELMSM